MMPSVVNFPIQIDPFKSDRISRVARAKQIIAETAAAHGISLVVLTGDTKIKSVVKIRRIAAKRVFNETGLNPGAIGKLMDNRDHATILHMLRSET